MQHSGMRPFGQGGGPCRGARAVQTLGICGAPTGGNCSHQEASRNEQELPTRLGELLAAIRKNNLGRQVSATQENT